MKEVSMSSTLLKYILVQLSPQSGRKKLLDTLFPDTITQDTDNSLKEEKGELDLESLFSAGSNLSFDKVYEAIDIMKAEVQNDEVLDTTVQSLFEFGDEE